MLQQKITNALKEAMKAKNQIALQALRAIKSELLLAKSATGNAEISEADEVKILSKLVKQRKDSASIFKEQGRNDLAEPEILQAQVISQFLPEQLSEEEIEKEVSEAISHTHASGMKDMGKVMGILSAKLSGKADGKTLANLVKKALS